MGDKTCIMNSQNSILNLTELHSEKLIQSFLNVILV